MDIDQEATAELVEKFQIQGVPTYFLVKDGKVVEQVVGQRTKGDMQDVIEKVFVQEDKKK